ncbi:two component transcriptional regulator, LuxR family [Salegentibacter echinorum]|uniref:Two component transcriptional regulator, LuxR family n=1 Tax=Salegentibacter echinorum TaxID=1073325 RepID=A0A1M5JDB3_SALEC|nr:response regulator transcription factor [Salegentibacter echinorum]SHG38260.1 two component transcriptional regulator, LuxR family [Salegentibacter echinorum]
MSTVLIADHHPLVHEGIRGILEKDATYEIGGTVRSGMALYGYLSESQPDLLIIEIDLPGINGINALRTIKKDYTKVKILVCSSHPEEVYALSTIKAGASGYVCKTAKLEEIEAAIHQVSRGGIYLNKKITDKLNTEVVSNKNFVTKFKKLSTRESEVLSLISAGKRNKDIAEALSINEKTVSTYKTRLLKKLQVDNIADLITRSRLLQLNVT